MLPTGFFFFFYQHKVLRLLAVLFDWQVQCGNILSTSVEKDEKQWKICPPLSILRRVIRWNFNTHAIQWLTDKDSKISKCSPSKLFLLIAFPALLPFQTGWYVSWHEIKLLWYFLSKLSLKLLPCYSFSVRRLCFNHSDTEAALTSVAIVSISQG